MKPRINKHCKVARDTAKISVNKTIGLVAKAGQTRNETAAELNETRIFVFVHPVQLRRVLETWIEPLELVLFMLDHA